MSTTPAPTSAASPWVLDTSVVLDVADPAVLAALPDDTVVSVVTLAELAAGPLMTEDPDERARRQHHLQEFEALYDPLPVNAPTARAFGEVAAAVRQAGRQPRCRQLDLLVAATARAYRLPLATRNASDLTGLEHLIDIRPV